MDDEAHCLFLCEHPTIVEAQNLFLLHVVPPVTALSSLKGMLIFGHYLPLAGFLSQRWSSVLPFVSVGLAISLVVHTDVVDFPNVLLPEGQYLDMFNSESDLCAVLSDDELVDVP